VLRSRQAVVPCRRKHQFELVAAIEAADRRSGVGKTPGTALILSSSGEARGRGVTIH
jgi:hypothetical protein